MPTNDQTEPIPEPGAPRSDYEGSQNPQWLCIGCGYGVARHSELVSVRRAGEVRVVNHRRIKPRENNHVDL